MKYKEGEGRTAVSAWHIFPRQCELWGGSPGIKLDYNMNMIDSSQNTFYDHADGKICIVVYLFDQK